MKGRRRHAKERLESKNVRSRIAIHIQYIMLVIRAHPHVRRGTRRSCDTLEIFMSMRIISAVWALTDDPCGRKGHVLCCDSNMLLLK